MVVPNRLDGYKLLHEGILAFSRAEQAGIRVDLEYCERKKKHLTRKIEHLEEKFKETNFYRHWQHVYGNETKISSDYQLAHILYNVKKLEPVKTTKRGKRGSTDEDALRQLNIPELDLRIESGKLQKLRDTYLEAFVREQVNGYIHPFFNLNNIRTYRSSSDHPNFQNNPKRDQEAMEIVRRALFPRPGHQLGEVDYKGIEVSVSACYNLDPVMIKYVSDLKTDMHGDMARELFILPNFDRKIPDHKVLRDASKNGFVFPQFYGSYYGNCAVNLAVEWGELPRGRWTEGQGVPLNGGHLSDHLIKNKIRSYDDFERHVQTVEERFWGERFRVYQQWKNDWWSEYQKRGYFDLYTGFRCSGVMSEKEACNYPIQGSAFHCLLWSFIQLDRIQREEGWDTRLIGQIHDAIILDINPSELDHVMETVRRVTCVELPKAWEWIIVPFTVEAEVCGIDESWDMKKPYNFAA